jgi:orotidine-5'-phosphate decarboxylase
MDFYSKWKKRVELTGSFLCVGLDTHPNLIPPFLLKEKNPVVKFNREIISATSSFVCAYKLNAGFYESQGKEGFKILEDTQKSIPEDIPTIFDGKRGDIGNSSKMYAKTIFEVFGFDGTTVNPYLGGDGIEPFLTYKEKYIFILCLTSNPGAKDLQFHGTPPLYLKVASLVNDWETYRNCGVVVGATKSEYIKEIRKIIKNKLMLIPGVGAQGGKVGEVIKYGGNYLLINSSRGIIYASSGKDFAQKAGEKAKNLCEEIKKWRKKWNVELEL